jgi:hypothetical protein
LGQVIVMLGMRYSWMVIRTLSFCEKRVTDP